MSVHKYKNKSSMYVYNSFALIFDNIERLYLCLFIYFYLISPLTYYE